MSFFPNSFSYNTIPVPLVYPSIHKQNTFINILLIDNQVKDFQIFVDSVNTSTFPIVYSNQSSKAELLSLLQDNFKTINRIGIVFTSNYNYNFSKMMLDRKPFFENDSMQISENTLFIINLIKEFNVKNIDFLACNTLYYTNWKDYYQLLTLETGITVGASNNLTGNIKYGGDWIMESTSEDIELVYFTKNIEYYTYLLDNLSWSTGYNGSIGQMVFDANYMYFPEKDFTINQTNLNGSINNYYWAESFNSQCCVVNNGYLYVTNDDSNKITQINLSNPTIVNANWATGLTKPIGLVINGSYLYVSNSTNNTISRITLANPSDKVLSWATSTQGIRAPYCLTTDGLYLYVCNNFNYTISKISFTNPTTDYYPSWATSTTQGLNYPVGLAIYGNYLYVSNENSNNVSKISLINPDTDFTTSWKTGFDRPRGISVYDNNLYVFNFNNGNISQISFPTDPIICFKENSFILTNKGYKPIQELRKGDLVKTLLHGFKPIDLIGKREIYHPANFKDRIKDQLYICTQSEFPELFEPLVITGCHSLLVDNFINEKQKIKAIEVNGDLFITDNKYRLPALTDPRVNVFPEPGKYNIYHLALENEDPLMNYGIYANGLLVETCSIRNLLELSNMTLLD